MKKKRNANVYSIRILYNKDNSIKIPIDCEIK